MFPGGNTGVRTDSGRRALPGALVAAALAGAVALSGADAPAVAAGGGSFSAAISADGRCVAYAGTQGAVPPEKEELGRIYVRDRRTGTTRRASRVPTEDEEGRGYDSPRISADGGKVAYRERSRRGGGPGGERDWADIHLHDRHTGEQRQIDTAFVRDVRTGAIQRVDGVGGNRYATADAIGPDGRTAVFESHLDDVVAGDTNYETDVFLRHVR